MKITIKTELTKEINAEEITTYDVHYFKAKLNGNTKGSKVIGFLNMPSYDDIIDNKPFEEYTTIIKERRIIKDLDNGKYIFNYPYSNKSFTPQYYNIIEN